MAIKFLMLGAYDEDEGECEEYVEEYATEEEAQQAWNMLCRAYVQGESEDTIGGVYFEDDDVEIELELRFDEYDWDEIIEMRDDELGACEVLGTVEKQYDQYFPKI